MYCCPRATWKFLPQTIYPVCISTALGETLRNLIGGQYKGGECKVREKEVSAKSERNVLYFPPLRSVFNIFNVPVQLIEQSHP